MCVRVCVCVLYGLSRHTSPKDNSHKWSDLIFIHSPVTPSPCLFPPCAQALDSDLKECGVKLSTAAAEKSQLEEELKELVKTRAKMEMDMRDMEKRVAEDESTAVRERGGREGG